MAIYLGQPCPLVAPVPGRFFGKKGQVIDSYGANLAMAVIPGGGHRVFHNQLQSLVQAMMKLGGMFVEKEAFNFLLSEVEDPYITQYVNHVSSATNSRRVQHAIVPDLHACNFPAGR